MKTIDKIFPNMYRDSVALMLVSAALGELPGVDEAVVIMATEANIQLLRDAGLLRGAPEAGPNDLLLVVRGADGPAVAEAAREAERRLSETPDDGGAAAEIQWPPRSIEQALAAAPRANLALISCPGDFAGAEAMKALRLGLDVMVFSDGVSIECELRLKAFADETGLLVMGPDCGTAIINGVPLGFANVVARGNIGLVAASGTGLQQVTCLIDRWGAGVSQAIGTGGRDLAPEIGGRAMIRGIELLARDAATEVIVLISKPPGREVAARVLAAAGNCGKPVIVNFLGLGADAGASPNIRHAETLEDAARLALGSEPEKSRRHDLDPGLIRELAGRLGPGQDFVRGLYSGGTLAYESQLILESRFGPLRPPSPTGGGTPDDPRSSRGHGIVDLGGEMFTRGRPHPMIDHRLRNQRLIQEAGDPGTAVILLDIVLGHGAHPDPAAAMTPALDEARERARASGRDVHFVGFICGTSGDPQDMARQEMSFTDAGVILTESNAQAARLAAEIVGAKTKDRRQPVVEAGQ